METSIFPLLNNTNCRIRLEKDELGWVWMGKPTAIK